ncbi:MAG: DUF937 domain-containing protein [Actinomycetia bacterium]|nr:DUF937 domain-containing protein [Actinomycetes bacterium]
MARVGGVLQQSLSPRAIGSLGRSLGISSSDTRRLVGTAMPVILKRLDQNAHRGGAADLAWAVARDQDGSRVDTATAAFLAGGFRKGPSLAILGHIFGDELDSAIASVAERTRLSPTVVKLGFAALAPLAMGTVTKAAVGVASAVAGVKLLEVATDQVRSGRVQRTAGRMHRFLDTDDDGKVLDDLGQATVRGLRRGGRRVAATARFMARDRSEHHRAP